MATFKLKIVTPHKIFFEGETPQIILRTVTGEMSVMPRHERYVSVLPAGMLRIKIDDSFKAAAISQGSIKVSREETLIIASSVEWADEIDVERAKRAEEKARELLNQKLSDIEFKQAELKLKRALNRLLVYSSVSKDSLE